MWSEIYSAAFWCAQMKGITPRTASSSLLFCARAAPSPTWCPHVNPDTLLEISRHSPLSRRLGEATAAAHLPDTAAGERAAVQRVFAFCCSHGPARLFFLFFLGFFMVLLTGNAPILPESFFV